MVERLTDVVQQVVALLEPLADEVHDGGADVDHDQPLPRREQLLPVTFLHTHRQRNRSVRLGWAKSDRICATLQ